MEDWVAIKWMDSMQELAIGGVRTHASSNRSKRLRMSESHSGLSVTEFSKKQNDSAYYMEMAFKLVGVLLIPAGGIVMFLPQIVAGHASSVTQVAMLAAFVFCGVALHRWADKGFRRRIHINPTRRELCIGTLNADNRFCRRSSYGADLIESFFIVRSKDPKTPAKLTMRLKAGARSICLFEGSEAALVPVLERISKVMQPPQQRNRRVRTQANGGFIRVSFG